MSRTHIAVLISGMLLTSPALAHPHIFVDATAQLFFDKEGRAVTLHNIWTFDEGYSSFAIQGLDADLDGKVTRNELQSLADENVAGLAEYGYYSSAGLGAKSVPFVNGRRAALDYVDNRVTLSFDVDFAIPVAMSNTLELDISDPQYYLAIQFASRDTIDLVGAPPGCGVELQRPEPMPDGVAAELSALPADITKLPARLQAALRGVQGAILINCGGPSSSPIAEASTAVAALDAFMDLAEAEQPILVSTGTVPVEDPVEANPWRIPVLAGAGLLVLSMAAIAIFRGRRQAAGPRWK
ncbi:MAG: DUF1007 family protein [Devosia sp.]|uniref:DUF1007 family protein n=1 Tax=Devosia sp. 66-22 TaxID=1895753 RepID=UPI000AD40060|nr:DUF1007 family protein [Devosia sp. 66-22]MBN9348044.1 DUF1007 family protein [Devosia sp.]